MAARTMKVRHQEDVRTKIQATQLVNFLTGHALGKKKASPSQVTAALGLLKKTLPDLTATEHTGNMTLTHEQQLAKLK